MSLLLSTLLLMVAPNTPAMTSGVHNVMDDELSLLEINATNPATWERMAARLDEDGMGAFLVQLPMVDRAIKVELVYPTYPFTDPEPSERTRQALIASLEQALGLGDDERKMMAQLLYADYRNSVEVSDLGEDAENPDDPLHIGDPEAAWRAALSETFAYADPTGFTIGISDAALFEDCVTSVYFETPWDGHGLVVMVVNQEVVGATQPSGTGDFDDHSARVPTP